MTYISRDIIQNSVLIKFKTDITKHMSLNCKKGGGQTSVDLREHSIRGKSRRKHEDLIDDMYEEIDEKEVCREGHQLNDRQFSKRLNIAYTRTHTQ